MSYDICVRKTYYEGTSFFGPPGCRIEESGNERAVPKPSNIRVFADASVLAIRNREKILAAFYALLTKLRGFRIKDSRFESLSRHGINLAKNY